MTLFVFNTRCILDDINSLLVALLRNHPFVYLILLLGGMWHNRPAGSDWDPKSAVGLLLLLCHQGCKYHGSLINGACSEYGGRSMQHSPPSLSVLSPALCATAAFVTVTSEIWEIDLSSCTSALASGRRGGGESVSSWAQQNKSSQWGRDSHHHITSHVICSPSCLIQGFNKQVYCLTCPFLLVP